MAVKEKQSNYELMRIVSMFFIVLWHVILHGNVVNHTSGALNIFFNFVYCILVVHVNSFMLLTGYFGYNKDFSLKRFFKNFNTFYFYKMVIYVALVILGYIAFNKIELMQIVNPFYITHWYVSCYLAFYLLTPFINILIKNLSQMQHRKVIIVLVLCFSLISFLSEQTVAVNTGFTISQFIMMYFIGSYLAKYPIENNIHFKNYSKNKKQLIFFLLTIFFVFINFGLFTLGIIFNSINSVILNHIGQMLTNNLFQYSSFVVILQSIFYFLWFGTLKIQNKFVNFIGSLTFGIYLIHNDFYLKTRIYKWFKIDMGIPITSRRIIIKVFIATVIIFIVCAFIEFIRQQIFKFIKNRKISKKLTKKFYDYIGGF